MVLFSKELWVPFSQAHTDVRTLFPSSEVSPFQHTLTCSEKHAVMLQSDVLPWQYKGCCLILALAAAVPGGEA